MRMWFAPTGREEIEKAAVGKTSAWVRDVLLRAARRKNGRSSGERGN